MGIIIIIVKRKININGSNDDFRNRCKQFSDEILSIERKTTRLINKTLVCTNIVTTKKKKTLIMNDDASSFCVMLR